MQSQNLVNHNFSFLQVIHLQVSRINDADVLTGLNGRIRSFLFPSIATGTGTGTATGAAAAATTGASAITASSRSQRILGDEFEEPCYCPRHVVAVLSLASRRELSTLKRKVDTSNIPHRTVLFQFHTGTSKRGIENPKPSTFTLFPLRAPSSSNGQRIASRAPHLPPKANRSTRSHAPATR